MNAHSWQPDATFTMGKASRRHRMKDSVAHQECPVCLDALKFSSSDPDFPDNTLQCKNGHSLCTSCVGRLVQPCMHAPNERCSAFHFNCPMCRGTACMESIHVLVVLKGSWDLAVDAKTKARKAHGEE